MTKIERNGVVFLPINPDMVPMFWDTAAPLLSKALDYTGGIYSIDDVRELVTDARWGLWVAIEGEKMIGAVTSHIFQSPQIKVMEVVLSGGDELGKWLFGIELIEAYAKERGCSRITVAGRRGWLKHLTAYEPTAVVLERAL